MPRAYNPSVELCILPKSPIKEAMDLLGLSVQDMCAKTRLSNSTVAHTIAGMYPTPNYQIIRILDVVNPDLTKDYQTYRIARRMYSNIPHKLLQMEDPEAYIDLLTSFGGDLYTQPLSSLWEISLPSDFPTMPEINPHIEFRRTILDLSVTEYCAELCIERFNVQHLEANESHWRFPEPIYTSLVLAMGIKATDQLANVWRQWKKDNPDAIRTEPMYLTNRRALQEEANLILQETHPSVGTLFPPEFKERGSDA